MYTRLTKNYWKVTQYYTFYTIRITVVDMFILKSINYLNLFTVFYFYYNTTKGKQKNKSQSYYATRMLMLKQTELAMEIFPLKITLALN